VLPEIPADDLGVSTIDQSIELLYPVPRAHVVLANAGNIARAASCDYAFP